MFTYFAWCGKQPSNINYELDNFLTTMTQASPQVGASMPLAVLNGLLLLFGYPKGEALTPVASNNTDRSQCFRFPSDFPARLDALEDEALAETARRWAGEEVWEFLEVNPFDLYGFLLELRQLCRNRPDWATLMCCVIAP